jgi:Flp pilus assembly pilin Flp
MPKQFSARMVSAPSRGAALVEYGLLIGLVAVVSIVSVERLGGQVKEVFELSSEALEFQAGESGAMPGSVTHPEAIDPPAPAKFMAWTMTSGRYTSGTTEYRGFRSTNPSTGSLTMSDPSMIEVAQFFRVHSGANYASSFQINGDKTAELVGATLVCNHGSWPLDNVVYDSVQKHTNNYWPKGAGIPDFVQGQTYTCEITKD